LLIGLLLPALVKARRAGKAAFCLSNLRTFAVAESDYESRFRNAMCLNLYSLLSPTYNPSAVAPGQTLNAETQNKILTCPSVSDYVNIPQDGTGNFFYGFNGWLTGANRVVPGGLKVSNVHDTSEVVLMADVIKVDVNGFYITGSDGLADPFWGITTDAQVLSEPTFHGRHGGSGAVLWVDGHASLEPAVAVPSTALVNPSNFGSLTQSPNWFNAVHLGYLARSTNDLTNMGALYYFVSPKDQLARGSMDALLVKVGTGSGAYYTPNPAQW
jgi:prepilin-type processing-associated H-X9-DG protein